MNTKGFALIEVMISMAISLALIWVISDMNVRMAKSMNAQKQSLEFMDLTQTLSGILHDSSQCTAALMGQPFSNAPNGVQTVILNSSTGPITTGTQVGSLKITSLSVENIGLIPATLTSYDANLMLSASRTGDITGPRGIHQKIRFQLQLAGSYIASCGPQPTLSLLQVCLSIHGTFDPLTGICGGFTP